MYVRTCKLYQEDGWPLPRHRLAMLQATGEGWLECKQAHDSQSGALMQRARLTNDEGQLLGELLHAVVFDLENGMLRIRGLERDPMTKKEYAMAWYCEVIDGRWKGQDARGPRPV